MNKPFFTVVIPTLNEEFFLPQLLDCLLKQTDRSFEIIVVDGGSTDKTIQKIEEFQPTFAQKNISLSVIVSPKQNVSFQRNLGAEKARGTYYIFFDADVMMNADYIERVHDAINRDKAPFLTTWTDTNSTNPQDKALVMFTNLTFEAAQFIHFDFVPGFNVIVKNTVFKKVGGFDVKVIHAEDHHFAQKVKAAGYHLLLLKEPRIIFSLRRFHREGTLSVLRRYTKSTLHIFLKGPITEEIFNYEMGGHLYDSKELKHKGFITKETIKKWRKQIEKQLLELERSLNT